MKKVIYSTRKITAADEDDFLEDEVADDTEFGFNDEDLNIDDVREDDPTIEIDNNISGHYIAECERWTHSRSLSCRCRGLYKLDKGFA